MDFPPETEQHDRNVAPANPISLSKYSNRVELKTLLDRTDGVAGLAGERVVIGGWVKSSRAVKKDTPPPPPPPAAAIPSSGGCDRHGPGTTGVDCTECIQWKLSIFRKIFDVLSCGGLSLPADGKPESSDQKGGSRPRPPPPAYILYFLISDGSSVSSLQVVVDSALLSIPASQLMGFGACIVAEGVLRHPTAASGKQAIELKTEKLLHVGVVDSEKYPLSKKQLPLHLLRDYSHFRPRTTTVASVTRIYSALNFASHTFFQFHGFHYIQVPVITTTDGEGFSEKFQVTTLLGKAVDMQKGKDANEQDEINLDVAKAAVKEKSKLVEQLKRSESNREAMVAAVQDLKKTSDFVAQLEMKRRPKQGTLEKPEKLDYTKDFFSCETYLTVSGRFHLESYACALGNVFTFGPRFRADKIDNTRHLAEMWNVETEMAFSELNDAMNCADEFFKFICKYVLENRSEDIKFVSKRVDKTIINCLESIASGSLQRLSYDEVISLLQKVEP